MLWGIHTKDLSIEQQCECIKTCLYILPQTKERIISEEDYDIYRKIMAQKRKGITDVHSSSKIDTACADHDIIEVACQLLEVLLNRLKTDLIAEGSLKGDCKDPLRGSDR